MIAPKSSSTTPSPSKSSRSNAFLSGIRLVLLDLPTAGLFVLLLAALLIQRIYHLYVVPIARSYERGTMVDGLFYDNFDGDFTYYNRHCGPADITTRTANDLLVEPAHNPTQAADIMLQHGAVAFTNVLRNDTATKLRAYLATKHLQRSNQSKPLGYNEVFWSEQNRLSLGIGTRDHPAILEALEQVGRHPVITTALKGILGDDPAILEISTLTSLNGAEDQGIHSDSDWFGSSLLYSRNFLHSYSLFVALQDTSKDLGATTVCPGTHYCADVDLEEMCLENGSFEVSTNGHTGHDGLLRKGDAFMFNQNVWHRGPQNVDPDGLDRIMFILTFATAKDSTVDRRRQGLGTYYYQRYNLWGATFGMLKDASKTMVQPWSFFRAMGLTKTRGITWIHQFCQQLANGDEFYDDDELDSLVNLFDSYQIPRFLRSKSDTWKRFIYETINLWVYFLAVANGTIIPIYLTLSAIVSLSKREGLATGVYHSFKRLLFLLGSITILILALSNYIDKTDLAQSVTTGDVSVKPFPEVSDDVLTKSVGFYGPTTFPERNDVLIKTRFDADFFASYNRFLDFHPGNYRWNAMVSAAASLPEAAEPHAAKQLVRETLQQKEAGFRSRFLLQNPYTGAWSIMTESEAIIETQKALAGKRNPLVGALSQRLKHQLADARFGVHRETIMAQTYGEKFVNHWQRILYSENKENSTAVPRSSLKTSLAPTLPSRQKQHTFANLKVQAKTISTNPLPRTSRREKLQRGILSSAPRDTTTESPEDSEDDIHAGDKVWVYLENEEWYEGEFVEGLDEEWCLVYIYNSGTKMEVHFENLRRYFQFKEGDHVEVEEFADDEDVEYYQGTILHVHPDGQCSVEFEDGGVVEKVARESMFLLDD